MSDMSSTEFGGPYIGRDVHPEEFKSVNTTSKQDNIAVRFGNWLRDQRRVDPIPGMESNNKKWERPAVSDASAATVSTAAEASTDVLPNPAEQQRLGLLEVVRARIAQLRLNRQPSVAPEQAPFMPANIVASEPVRDFSVNPVQRQYGEPVSPSFGSQLRGAVRELGGEVSKIGNRWINRVDGGSPTGANVDVKQYTRNDIQENVEYGAEFVKALDHAANINPRHLTPEQQDQLPAVNDALRQGVFDKANQVKMVEWVGANGEVKWVYAVTRMKDGPEHAAVQTLYSMDARGRFQPVDYLVANKPSESVVAAQPGVDSTPTVPTDTKVDGVESKKSVVGVREGKVVDTKDPIDYDLIRGIFDDHQEDEVVADQANKNQLEQAWQERVKAQNEDDAATAALTSVDYRSRVKADSTRKNEKIQSGRDISSVYQIKNSTVDADQALYDSPEEVAKREQRAQERAQRYAEAVTEENRYMNANIDLEADTDTDDDGVKEWLGQADSVKGRDWSESYQTAEQKAAAEKRAKENKRRRDARAAKKAALADQIASDQAKIDQINATIKKFRN